MVAAQNGTIILAGRSGRQYSISYYASDVAAAACTFNLNGLAVAGSQTFYIIPEDCTIKDMCIHTGLTATVAFVPQVNDVNTGNVITAVAILDTNAYRAIPNISIAAGRKFTLIQA